MLIIPLSKDGYPLVKWGDVKVADPAWPRGDAIALVCGEVSSIIAVDVDTDDPSSQAKFEAVAGVSPVKKFGTKGFTAFYRYNGEESYSWKTPDKKVICEILSNKRLTTLPPSKHRYHEDVFYNWMGGPALGDVDLPFLSPGFVPFMNAEYPRPEYTYRPAPVELENVDLEEAADMLSYLDANMPRDEWVQIGMALRDEFGDSARALWHSWSAKADGNLYDFRTADSVWRSFNGGGVTVGTLIHYAKNNGWSRKLQTVEAAREEYEVDISYVFKKPSTEIKPHGPVGELAEWMTRTAWRPQPLLSLSASIVLLGFLKGRKFVTNTGVYSNVYAFNIAGSASGKDRPQAAIKYIMRRLDAANKLLPAPASGVGFIDGLHAAHGHGITMIDEMADYMSAATNKQSGAHQGKVLKYWLEAFTSQAGYIEGERRADAAKQDVKRIENPLFSLLGSTNPNSLKLALSGEQIANGLLNRFLFFHSNEMPRKRKARDFDALEQLPAHLVDKFSSYLANCETVYGAPSQLTVVNFTDDAMDYYDTVQDFYEDKKEEIDPSDPRQNLYGRAHEHVARVALILCDDRMITLKDVECAHAIVSLSVEHALAFCGDIVDTQQERDYIRVREIIKSFGEITLERLRAKTQFLKNSQHRSEIIEALDGAGLIQKVEIPTKGRKAINIKWIGAN